jgi:hypothetical protein
MVDGQYVFCFVLCSCDAGRSTAWMLLDDTI